MADGNRVARRSLGGALALGFAIDLAGILIQAVYDIVADDDSPPWLRNAFIGAGALLALGKLGLDVRRSRADQAQAAPPGQPHPASVRPPSAPGPGPGGAGAPRGRPRTVSAVAGLVVVLVLCGVGGVAVSWAAGRATEFARAFEPPWAAGDRVSAEPGVQRLAEPVTRRTGTLTVTVTEVEVNQVVTSITMTVRSTSTHNIVMPVSQLTVPGSATLARAFNKGTWSDVPPGGEMTGILVYEGAVPGDVTSVTVQFPDIFGGLDDPRSMSVPVQLTSG